MSINHRAGLCEGWKRGAAACNRMVTPGFRTCTYHRHQEATVIALADPRAGSCNGWNYHTFTLGSNVCSMCGWKRA